MNKTEYIEQVAQALRRTTYRENLAIREELAGHIEDHMEGLLELGWDEALAEERTLAAMGDPAEVARELDRQYPLFWLIIGRITKKVLVLLVIVGFFQMGELPGRIRRNIPSESHLESYDWIDEALEDGEALYVEDLDIRTEIGSDILYIYRLAIGEADERGSRVLLSAITYDHRLTGIFSYNLINDLEYASESMEKQGLYRDRHNIYAQPGDRYVVVRYNKHGHDVRVEIPLHWEEAGYEAE